MAYPAWIFVALVSLIASLACKTINRNAKPEQQFRDYDNARPHVKSFYQAQHKNQTYSFAKDQQDQIINVMAKIKKADEKILNNLENKGLIKRLTMWDAIKELDKLTDESDPDFLLPNSYHAFQTAEAIRKDLPKIAEKHGVSPEAIDWFILVGLLHDIGKIDAILRPVPQWSVVGDSFPVGCQYSDKNIFYDYFKDNPDFFDKRYNTTLGIYPHQVGLEKVVMSFGHDEYSYQVLKAQGVLPKEALSMLRFHSFYPLHREHAYEHLLQPSDYEQIEWVRSFSPYDLYSKHEDTLSVEEHEQYYKSLINKYFPPEKNGSARKIAWPILKPVT